MVGAAHSKSAPIRQPPPYIRQPIHRQGPYTRRCAYTAYCDLLRGGVFRIGGSEYIALLKVIANDLVKGRSVHPPNQTCALIYSGSQQVIAPSGFLAYSIHGSTGRPEPVNRGGGIGNFYPSPKLGARLVGSEKPRLGGGATEKMPKPSPKRSGPAILRTVIGTSARVGGAGGGCGGGARIGSTAA